jgi:hypothetical protein
MSAFYMTIHRKPTIFLQNLNGRSLLFSIEYRVNKHLHACLNNPDTWRSLCKIFYPNQWLYLEGREAQERDPSVTWKNLVLWNYWLEVLKDLLSRSLCTNLTEQGTYETSRPAVQSTVPINAQRLVVQKVCT